MSQTQRETNSSDFFEKRNSDQLGDLAIAAEGVDDPIFENKKKKNKNKNKNKQ